jgi:hypothetical protein
MEMKMKIRRGTVVIGDVPMGEFGTPPILGITIERDSIEQEYWVIKPIAVKIKSQWQEPLLKTKYVIKEKSLCPLFHLKRGEELSDEEIIRRAEEIIRRVDERRRKEKRSRI